MRIGIGIAMMGAATLLSGCMAGPSVGPVDVTRYHLGQQIAAATVTVEPMTSGIGPSPEFMTYAEAVRGELVRLGYSPVGAAPSDYVASVAFLRTSRGAVRRRSPVSIGLGGGGYSGGIGLGGGVSLPVGGGRADELIATELRVQLRRRTDNSVVWEGSAVTETLGNAPETQPGATANRLARALFKGFPGESGITITVK